TGLWILKPTYKRAAYLEGTVRDTVCNVFLTGVTIEIVGDSVTDQTNYLGKYSTGTVDSGTYTIRFSKPGYQTVNIPNVNLVNGQLTTIDVILTPTTTTRLVIKTVDAQTGTPIAQMPIHIQEVGSATFEETTTGANGERFYCNFVQGNYNFYAGKWGYKTALVTQNINTGTDTVVIEVTKGYYDDFLLDFGWTVTSTADNGLWEKDKPEGTDYNGTDCNPGNDVPGDFGDECYTTGNGGGQAGEDDIDNGYTLLTSPVFDLTGYNDAYISYYRWFFNDGGNGTPPNDSLKVILTNGTDIAVIDMLNADSVQGQWRYKNIRVSDYMFTSANMRISFRAEDTEEGHLVEAGLDLFQIVDSAATSTGTMLYSNVQFKAYPNPFENSISFTTNTPGNNHVLLTNMLGEIVETVYLNGQYTTYTLTNKLPAGIYMARLYNNNQPVNTIRLIHTGL
ncbi:MAG TPA: carboxypeptidase regulatory-like domain-containing protein, partial [Chitinophagales bacterium]|nr:carboxypeptidase regulatory-like domain-containing protein [Chitinophagales bacterium]